MRALPVCPKFYRKSYLTALFHTMCLESLFETSFSEQYEETGTNKENLPIVSMPSPIFQRSRLAPADVFIGSSGLSSQYKGSPNIAINLSLVIIAIAILPVD